MRQHYLVRPQHLNHHETLFGGQMMAWADEAAYLAASIKYPRTKFVTKVSEAFNFTTPVLNGDIVEIETKIEHEGRTSCKVEVIGRNQHSGKPIFSTVFIMVNVDDNGAPKSLHQKPNVFDPGLSFVQTVLRGDACKGDIDHWIEAWHNPCSTSVWRTYDKDVPLHEALGMSQEQYALWVKDPHTIQEVLDQAWQEKLAKK